MYRATADNVLPTTIIGPLPRPSWYSEDLGRRSFLEAMVNARFREQYMDAAGAFLKDRETAGIDLVIDGHAHRDGDVGGQSWTRYPTMHMSGFAQAGSDGRARARDKSRPPRARVARGGVLGCGPAVLARGGHVKRMPMTQGGTSGEDY